jgi:8-oxo-dGTP diphosphatase
MVTKLVSQTPPADFHPTLEVAGCYCEFEDKILFLKRSPHKKYGTSWGIPGGKLEAGETPVNAVIREVFEEVGFTVQASDLTDVGTLYIRHPDVDYIFHRFRTRFTTIPLMDLSLEEHIEARWVTFEEAMELPLISGGKEALVSYQEFRAEKKKAL